MKLKIFAIISLIITTGMLNNINAQQATQKGLTIGLQGIVSIAALTAKGDLPKPKTRLNTGLDARLRINQIREAIVHLYAYY